MGALLSTVYVFFASQVHCARSLPADILQHIHTKSKTEPDENLLAHLMRYCIVVNREQLIKAKMSIEIRYPATYTHTNAHLLSSSAAHAPYSWSSANKRKLL